VEINPFDLRNSKASVEIVKAAAGGADTILGIVTDADNFARIVVHAPGASSSVVTPAAPEPDGAQVPLDTTTAQLIFQVKLPGQPPVNLTIPYDPVQHRFMRFR